MPTLAEKQQERGQLWEQAKKINEKATAEKRKLTAEEATEWDRLTGEYDRLGAEIKRDEQLEARQLELAARPAPTGGRPDPEPKPEDRLAHLKHATRALIEGAAPEVRGRLEQQASPAYRVAFRGYAHDGTSGLNVALAALPAEQRNTLQMDVFTKGGALVAPLELVLELIKNVDDDVFVRQRARRFTVTQAEAMGAPTLDTDPADADWTSELLVGNQGTMAFGRRELRPHPLAKWMKVSNKLLRASAMSPETLVRERLAYKFSISSEKAYLSGSGVQQPLGVFTASADGIPTSRDVSTGNSTTDIGADGLIEAKHTLKGNYWGRSRWIFHRDAIKRIRKLKDGNGQYLWQPGISAGIPDRILETPYDMSEYAPNTFTTGLYVGLIGDWSWYWVVDALDLTIQRLVELYAATNETGFIGRLETDGAPVLSEAFVRVKLA